MDTTMMQRAWLVFGLTACCAWGAESSPKDGLPQVILHCDFDTDAWLQQWGVSEAPERTQLVEADPERKFEPLRGRALRVQVEQGGHYGLSLEFPFKKRLGYEPEEAAGHYRYYVCVLAQKRGWETCPSPSLPAAEIERLVVDPIRGIGRDSAVVAETVRQVREQAGVEIAALRRERTELERGLRKDDAELRKIADGRMSADERMTRLAEVHDHIQAGQRRIAEIDADLVGLGRELIDEREVSDALAEFDGVWESLTPQEQTRMLELLIERVDWDGAEENVSITLRPSGIKSLSGTLVEAT